MPRRKPTALKMLAGTARPDRMRNEPKPKPIAPACPKDLPREAERLWKSLAPKLERLGLLTETDGPAFADMCLCWARLREAERDISERGLLVPGERGLVKNPAAQLAREYRAGLQKWAARFGLTPADRSALDLPADEDDDLDRLLDRLWGERP